MEASRGPSSRPASSGASLPAVQPPSLPVERFLAAIMAHELGNPFTALLGRLELMEIRKGLPDAVRRDLEAMRTAGDRMARILENLKTFSRGDVQRPEEISLREVAERSLDRFAALRPDIALTRDLPAPGLKVQADPVLLEEVILSTLVALVERGGAVTRMDIGWGEDREVDEVSIVMRDDGRFLSEEEVARLFHPFSGTELTGWRGLVSLSYGYYIIRAWGGTFRFPRAQVPTGELCLVAVP